mmetsp:Transcript_63745/g.143874  ORF Transcript_63745/g.143874 Transcript_63745/m.143874 type:complete len:233 (+) Transcript_63745:372-1070(+)
MALKLHGLRERQVEVLGYHCPHGTHGGLGHGLDGIHGPVRDGDLAVPCHALDCVDHLQGRLLDRLQDVQSEFLPVKVKLLWKAEGFDAAPEAQVQCRWWLRALLLIIVVLVLQGAALLLILGSVSLGSVSSQEVPYLVAEAPLRRTMLPLRVRFHGLAHLYLGVQRGQKAHGHTGHGENLQGGHQGDFDGQGRVSLVKLVLLPVQKLCGVGVEEGPPASQVDPGDELKGVIG